MADRYWVGGSANWDGTAGTKWATTSGGAGGAAVPTSSDDVFFDAASGAVTITLAATGTCRNLTCTGFTGTFARGTQTLDIYGSLLLVSGMTYTDTSTAITNLRGSSGSFTITTANKLIGRIEYIGGSAATYSFMDTSQVGGLRMQGDGIVDFNDQNITFGFINYLTVSLVSGLTLKLGNGTITMAVSSVWTESINLSYHSLFTLNKENSTINITATGASDYSATFTDQTINNLTINTTRTVNLVDGGLMNVLTLGAGSTLTLDTGRPTGFSSLTSNGTGANHATIQSDTPGTQSNLLATGGTDISADYLTIKDTNANNSSVNWFAGDHSTDNGNNSGWIFHSLETFLAISTKRNVTGNLLVSWKKNYLPTISFFTIGVSTIGGNDIIAASESIDSRWNQYQYTDESAYIMGLEWEQALNMPTGGIAKGLAGGRLDNNSGRFLPRYMGGSSELFTAILPSRPFIINAGFEYGGVDLTDPQFVGLFNRQPRIDLRNRTMDFNGEDFIGFIQDRYVDDTVMYTGQRSDQLIENLLSPLGFVTAQYDLDTGINRIPFAIFNRGDRIGDIIHRITEAENAHFFQDERGVLKFENRQHWDSGIFTAVQWELFTSQVLEAEAPDDDHIINVVEVRSKVRDKQPEQTIFKLVVTDAIEIPFNGTKELFVDFQDPVLSVTTPTSTGTISYFVVNTQPDGSGTDISSSISITKATAFAQAAKFVFSNPTTNVGYLIELVVSGRPAKVVRDVYVRDKDDSSVTAYQEHRYLIENDYIQEEDWAESFAAMVLRDFGEPEKLQTITIKAIPGLKIGDLISWQGRYWRIFGKRTRLSPEEGFLQELQLLQRDIVSYFRIGISTIGGGDLIAP